MPEDSKKNHHKAKHDAKEQRKPRQQRQHGAEKSEKKAEKKVEETKVTAPLKPAYEEPGPEFYKNLKRETDEILKITEEANAKYKKKEIQSNWTKYEMPIESYEEMEEQENLGADYEKLIQAPMSSGGHFQFKHEKSWDINTGPSLYDKYFDINMDNLATAISTIPFFERMSIDHTVFSQTDITSMNNRAVKYKRKYYNDKSYTTPELETQDAIINNLKESPSNNYDKSEEKEDNERVVKTSISESADIVLETNNEDNSVTKPENIVDDFKDEPRINDNSNILLQNPDIESNQKSFSNDADKLTEPAKIQNEEIDDILENTKTGIKKTETPVNEIKIASAVAPSPTQTKVADTHSKERKPVIESPEDLEKWLDDFLDG